MPASPTADEYRELVAAFHKHGPNFSAVAREVGCSRGRARKAWQDGYPHADPPLAPISETYGEAEKAVRAAAIAAVHGSAAEQVVTEAIEDELATLDALKWRSGEAVLLRRHMGAALKIGQAFDAIADAMPALMDRVRAALHSDLNPIEVIGVVKDLAFTGDRLATTIQRLMEAERLHVGEPQAHVRVDALSPEEIQETLATGERALERAKRLGIYVVDAS